MLCDEVMENSDSVIQTHLNSRKHSECYMKRLMARHSLFIKNTALFCCLCNHNVGITELTHHIDTIHHCKTLSSVKEFIEKDGDFLEISDNNNNINCCICNGQVEFTLESVENHITSAKHRRAKVMVLQPLNGIFSVEDNDEYLWCKLCQKFFDNYIELILQHVEESEHAKTMRKILRLIDGQNITIENYLQSLSQDKAFCMKCEIEVPCNVDNLQRHINGRKHDKKYWSQAIDDDSSEETDISDETILDLPDGSIVCCICKEHLPRVSDDKMEDVKLEHKRLSSHQQVLCVLKHHSISFDNCLQYGLLLCRICQRSLEFEEKVTDHVMDVGHRAWFTDMEHLIISESVLVSTSYISIDKFLKCESDFARCKICNLDIECTINGLFVHTSSESHRKEFLQALIPCTALFTIEDNKVMWCKACDFRMDNNTDEVLEHLTESEEHGRWFHDVDIMCHQDISITDFLKDEKEMKVKCCRCDIKIKADPKSILAHVHSEPHRYRYKSNSLGTVKSLADQGIWPNWCHWNFFGHPALAEHI